jgi:hypothetical protein
MKVKTGPTSLWRNLWNSLKSKNLQIETNSGKEGKYMDFVPKTCLTKSIRGTSLHIPAICIPHIRKEYSSTWLAAYFFHAGYKGSMCNGA